jgi:hypothetical protein
MRDVSHRKNTYCVISLIRSAQNRQISSHRKQVSGYLGLEGRKMNMVSLVVFLILRVLK